MSTNDTPASFSEDVRTCAASAAPAGRPAVPGHALGVPSAPPTARSVLIGAKPEPRTRFPALPPARPVHSAAGAIGETALLFELPAPPPRAPAVPFGLPTPPEPVTAFPFVLPVLSKGDP